MPIEEFEEEGLKKIPDLELAQALFTVQSVASNQEKESAKQCLEKAITDFSKYISIL